MDIFGIGGTELLAIFIIMLVVAGPKRMIHWAYILGQYTAKARRMWSEVMSQVQKEFDEAGVDIKLPKEPPTRGALSKEIIAKATKLAAPITQPIQEAINETQAEVTSIKQGATVTSKAKPSSNGVSEPVTPPPSEGGLDLGSWSGADSST